MDFTTEKYSKEQLEIVYNSTLNVIKKDFDNKNIWEQVIAKTKFCNYVNNIVYITCENNIAKNILNNDYLSLFNETLRSLLADNEISIEFISNEEKANYLEVFISQTGSNADGCLINVETKYDFEKYYVYEFNKQAYSLLNNIIEVGAWRFTPVFLYATTGLGKTHLVSAFAKTFYRKYPNKRVRYVEISSFVSDVFKKTRDSYKLEELKQEYSNYDIIIFDDIQHLQNKDKTNEIFFEIFNKLVAKNSLIIVCSDRKLSELSGFKDRIISRLSSGISINIKQPSEESLKELLARFLDQDKIKLTNEAISFILRYYHDDIRKLLGIFNQLSWHISMNNDGQIIDLKNLKDILDISDISFNNPNGVEDINPDYIINGICNLYKIKREDVFSKNRTKEVANVRSICMYLLSKKLNMNNAEIGAKFSRDRTTVISAISRAKQDLEKDKNLLDLIEKTLDPKR